ncbi:hypothetical protein C8J57DRAFT_1465037 [Mycena rebaudengoi]|nr:hypothetical protein C8J57DRAFT_1465037 [Mycena rebaudengoi]
MSDASHPSPAPNSTPNDTSPETNQPQVPVPPLSDTDRLIKAVSEALMEERGDPGHTPHQGGQFLDGAAKLLEEFGQALKDEPGMVQEGPRSVSEEEYWDGLRKKFEAELKEQERQEWMYNLLDNPPVAEG